MFVSGGAQGADFAWANRVAIDGYSIDVMSFDGHRRCQGPKDRIIMLTKEQLKEAQPWINKAAKSKGYTSSSNPFICRDWWIVREADAVVAVGQREGDFVEGGTGWTWQMHLEKDPVFLMWIFDQNVEKWFSWVGEWVECQGPPSLETLGRVALIGSRKLTAAGRKAIAQVKLAPLGARPPPAHTE